ncbi:MAG: hypothetical protein IJ087_00500 [Eggerthellaceae bacterium]|nr:hypothetical protein [Eggerthellaceae bacterium]
MTWKMMRVFKCSLCGREKHEEGGRLHPTWSGNDSEEGDCYCPECLAKLDDLTCCSFLHLDGNPHRVVCNKCGTSFHIDALSIDGNVPPDRCPGCKRRISKQNGLSAG